MFSRYIQAFALAALLSVVSHVEAQKPGSSTEQRNLVVVGAVLFMPLMVDIGRRFEALNPGVHIEVRLTGVAEGLSIIRAGHADIAMLQRPLQNNERDLFGHAIARDGVAIIVNGDNPLRNITSKELTGILTGRIDNWKALNVRDLPIRLSWRRGEGSTYFLLDYLKLKPEQLGPHVISADNDDSIKFVASNVGGISLASVAAAERAIKTGAAIRALPFDGFPASSRMIQNHAYPLSRPLLLVTRTLPQGLQQRFIEYSGSPRVLDLQLKYGFVPYEQTK